MKNEEIVLTKNLMNIYLKNKIIYFLLHIIIKKITLK